MIFDRTKDDVTAAQAARQKLQKGGTLTEQEELALERGALSFSTLNRIENKTAELAAKVNEMLYIARGVETQIWTSDDIFFLSDFQRILKNLSELLKAFYALGETPKVPTPRYNISVFNAVEKILANVEAAILDMQAQYRECGNVECGG